MNNLTFEKSSLEKVVVKVIEKEKLKSAIL